MVDQDARGGRLGGELKLTMLHTHLCKFSQLELYELAKETTTYERFSKKNSEDFRRTRLCAS